MPTSFQMIDRWFHRIAAAISIMLPGIAALFFIDLNVNIFRGEFGFTDFTNFNAVVLSYVDSVDLTGQQSIIYIMLMLLLIYAIGYFLNSSSKFFAGPQRFRSWLKLTNPESEVSVALPQAAYGFLQLKDSDLTPSAHEHACHSIISSSGILSSLPGLERRIEFYRAMGYLFCLMILLDLCLFIISFDFVDIILKLCLLIFNLTFAFLFFKGQDECAQQKKEALAAETLVAVAKLRS